MAPVPMPAASQLARIEGGKHVLQLTPDDLLWATRMAVWEGGDARITLWTLAQRWVMFADAGRATSSFGRLLQDFSQPINSKWARDGAFCRPGGEYAASYHCSEAKLARRDMARNSTYAELYKKNPLAYDYTMVWAQALVANPVPRGVDFSDEATSAGRVGPGQYFTSVVAKTPPDSCPSCNWILSTRASDKWPAGYVRMVAPSGRVADETGVIEPGGGNAFVRGLWNGATRWWRGA